MSSLSPCPSTSAVTSDSEPQMPTCHMLLSKRKHILETSHCRSDLNAFDLQAMDMLGSSLGHTSLSLGGLGDLGLGPDSHGLGHGHHEHLHPHQPLPPHRPLSPPVLPSHSHSLSSSSVSAVDSSFSPGSTSHLPSSTVKIKPGE